MLIVFNQMVSLFLLMLTGYLANRSGVIDKTFESKVSRFIVNISLPATILNAVTGSDMAHDQEMLPIFVAAVSIFLVAHVICHFIQKTIRWNTTYELMLNYSNLGFMGIPIISTIYGGEYVLHVSIFMMTFNLSLFSYGVYLLSKDDAKKTAAAAVSEVQAAAPENSGSQKSTGFNVKKLSLPRNPLRIPRHRHLSSRYPPPAACGQPVFYHWCHNNTACDDRHRFHSGRSEVFHGVYR